MTTAAREALERSSVPWLFATALITTLPHFEHQPLWLSALSSLIFIGGGWLWWRAARLPGRWLLALLVVAGCGGVLLQFHTLFGREAGVAMLVLFMALKLLELKSRRDAIVVVVLAYFLLLTHYFDSQSIPTGIWLFAASVAVTATLIRLHGGPASRFWPTLRYAGLLTLQSVPFMLVLYLLFPRVNGPLWGLPQDAHSARTGLSSTMSPGSIANLAQSGEIAFRARFEGAPPGKEKLYWRGPVMDEYDGQTWKPGATGKPAPPEISALSPALRYTLTLEAHNQRWLLALDAPTALPPNSRLGPSLTAFAAQAIVHRQRFELAATLDYRFNLKESPIVLQRALQLPPGRNPRTRELAESWRRDSVQPEQRVARALAFFRAQAFIYTLRPPLLGPEAMDDFLFNTRRGFCEHYASAFVVLMRAAGVPARVVGGYQGGELNPLDQHLVIRQSDAHAWAEVWIAGRGWVRVDPTAAIAPSRIESGIASALPEGELLPAFIQIQSDWLRGLRHRWEAVNNTWNQWVLGYNPERQREFLARLGLPDADWQTLTTLLFAACAVVLLAVTAWTLYHRPRPDPARRLWNQALRRLQRRRIASAPWETPLALAARLRAEQPEVGATMAVIAECYCTARYGPGPADLKALRRAVAALH